MALKLLRGRSNRKEKKPHDETLTTAPSDSSFPIIPPRELNDVYQDDDVSSIHFGESVSSPTYCYAQPASRRTSPSNSNNNARSSPAPLKFVRSDSHVGEHRPSPQLTRGSATPTIDNTSKPSPVLTCLLYQSLVTFEKKHDKNGKYVVRETLQRHVYKSLEQQLPVKRKSVPVDVDDCSFMDEDDTSLMYDMALQNLHSRNIPAAIDVYQSLLSTPGGRKCEESQLYSQLSVLYVLQGNRHKAVWSSERALGIHTKEGHAQEQVSSLLGLGVALLYSQKPAQALSKFRLALQLECKLVGYHHACIPLLLNNMAICHVVLGDLEVAMVLLQESLYLQRDAHQADLDSLKHTATTLLNLGIVVCKRNDYDRGISYFEEGLMVLESILGVEDSHVHLCSTRLEELLLERGSNGDDSLPKSLQIPVFGYSDGIPMRQGSHPVDVIVMGSLQHELTLEKRVRNSIKSTFHSGMLGVQAKAFKSVPIDVDGDAVMDAELYLDAIHAQVLKHVRRDEIYEGLDLLRSTLRSHKTKYGKVHHLVGMALHNIALVNLYGGRYKDAEWYFQEALEVRVAALGTEHPDVSASMLKLGMIQMANDDLDTANLTFTEVLNTRRKVIGYHQPEVAKILNLLGYVQFELGSLLAALKSMEEALEIQRDCSGCDEDVAVTLSNMGFLYAKTGKYAEATSVLRKALGIQRRVLSESHPRTIVTRNNLNHVLSLKSDSVVFIKNMDPCIGSALDVNCQPLSSFTPQWDDE